MEVNWANRTIWTGDNLSVMSKTTHIESHLMPPNARFPRFF